MGKSLYSVQYNTKEPDVLSRRKSVSPYANALHMSIPNIRLISAAKIIPGIADRESTKTTVALKKSVEKKKKILCQVFRCLDLMKGYLEKIKTMFPNFFVPEWIKKKRTNVILRKHMISGNLGTLYPPVRNEQQIASHQVASEISYSLIDHQLNSNYPSLQSKTYE